jgi:hypothetical protein
MHAAQIKLVELARRLMAVGVQAASAYNGEQAKLQLDLVLTQARLSSEVGTGESRRSLAQLRELTEAHKLAFKKLTLAVTAELTSAVSELPPELRAATESGMLSSINWQLDAQASFYATRERWLEAAEGICNLVEKNRDRATFTEDGVDFESDEVLSRFTELLGVIEQAHLSEVAALTERLERLGRSLAILGAVPSL